MSEPAPNRIPSLPRAIGLGLRPFPPRVLELVLQSVASAIIERHPKLLERLRAQTGRRIGIDPIDLPFAMLLEPERNGLTLRVVRELERADAQTRIRCPILALVGLLNGTSDGDALFFSRDIMIEGDMEGAVALRNAIDDAEIDLLHAASAWAGPFAGPLERIARLCVQGGERLVMRRQPSPR